MQTKKEQLKFSEMGAGQPLVFISGLSVDKSIWDGVLSVIKNDFHIIYFDNKGVGDNSNFSSPLTTLDMAKNVIDLIKNLNLKKVNIVGHSLGSYVAQHVAAACPNIVENLILISSRLKSSLITRLHYNVISKLLRANVSREILVEDSLSWLYGSTYLKNLQNSEKIIQEKLLSSPALSFQNFLNQVQAALNHDSSEISKKIKARTLLVNGDEDILCTAKEVALLARSITNSKLLILENVGHMIPVEAPDRLAKSLKNFCSTEDINEHNNFD